MSKIGIMSTQRQEASRLVAMPYVSSGLKFINCQFDLHTLSCCFGICLEKGIRIFANKRPAAQVFPRSVRRKCKPTRPLAL